MTSNTKVCSFRSSARNRIMLLVFVALSAILISLFLGADTEIDASSSGFALIISFIFVCALVGILVRLTINSTLVSVGPEGLSLNWLPVPICWEEILGGRVLTAQGFSFGLGWVELHLNTPMEMPPETDEGFAADGFVESTVTNWKQTVHAAPVWTLVTPTILRIATANLNVSPNELAVCVEAYLPGPLSRT
jgi:hypothetical protein